MYAIQNNMKIKPVAVGQSVGDIVLLKWRSHGQNRFLQKIKGNKLFS